MKRETGTVKAPRWITAARSVGVWLLFSATLQATTTPNPNQTPISLGQTVNGVLEASDARTRAGDGSFADNYQLTLTTAQTVTIEMSSSAFDTFLILVDSAENVVGTDDDGGGGTNSRLDLALPAGTFIIEATSFTPGDGGPYSLSVSGTGGPTILPTPISLGQTVNGVLEASDDRTRAGDGSFADNYQLTLATAQTVTIELSSSAFDTFLILVDDAENQVGFDDDGGTGSNSRLELALPAGTFIIEATSFFPGDGGPYTLSVSGTEGPTILPTPISLGQTVNGVLEASDDRTRAGDGSFADNYQLTLATAQTVTIELSSSAFDTFLILVDDAENQVGFDDDGGTGSNSRLELALPAGTFIIEATSFFPGDGGPYTLSVSGTEGPTILPTPISLGQTVNGVLEASDDRTRAGDGSFADNYQLTLATAQTVTIELSSSAFDTFLILVDDAENQVGFDDDGGTGSNSRLELALPAGTFIIEATSFFPGDGGPYTLSVSGTGGPTIPPTPISLGQTVNGVLEASDDRTRAGDGSFADNYQLTLTSAQTVTIEMSSSAFDTFLIVVDSAENLVDADDDGGGGSNSRLDLALPAGTFIIEATSFTPGDGGPYTLSVSGPGDHQVTGVLDAASFQGLISPGSIVSVFGNFVETTATAGSIPLTMNLNGFSVTFNDIPGALFGVFAGGFDQSNVQVPWNVDVSSGKLEVKVHWEDASGQVWSPPFEVDAGLASPGIFMFPPGTTQAIVSNFTFGEEDDVIPGSWAQAPGSVDPVVGQPAAIGGVATIWCSGLGLVTPLPATGNLPPPGTVPVTNKKVRVFVGGVEAQVLGSAVLQPLNVGLNQINIVTRRCGYSSGVWRRKC